VRSEGGKALVEALARFDGVDVEPVGLRVSEQEVRQAVASLPTVAQFRAFNEAALLNKSLPVSTTRQ
jgi:histidinol dehydrogenase